MFSLIGHFVLPSGQRFPHAFFSNVLNHIAQSREALGWALLPSQPPKMEDDHSKPGVSGEQAKLSPPISALDCDQTWVETEAGRGAFISRRIHDLVQSFQSRAEREKERLVQPPTPTPSPPPDTSSEREASLPSSPSTRPRLHSLIEDEKPGGDVPPPTGIHRCFQSFPTIIDPQSKLYISWLFFVMVSYSYNAWSIFFRAVFDFETPKTMPIFLTFDYLSDLIYLLDIAIFKVRLQFLHDGFWVENYKQTRANYFRKREFKLDVLSLLPLDLLYFVYGVHPLFRLPRFLKVQTFWEFFNRVDAVTKTPYIIRIIRTLMYMMYLIHLNACAYYAMSRWEGIGSNKWVFQGEGNAYVRCFYFATKTATSIGKNPKPENEIEYIFMTISWLMGVFIFAFLVGQIRDIVATATQSHTQYRQLMDQTVMYMRNLNLPDELQRRVRMWLNHNWEQQKTFDVGKILDTLPRKMKTDVAINVHYKTLVKVQLFKDCDKALLRDLVLQLKPVLFLPADYICKKGEVGKEMYIVNKGVVEVVAGREDNHAVLATLTKGSVFGEISLLGIPGCNRRTADVRSKGFSNLFVLSKDDLWEALKNYPEAQKVLKKKAKNIIKENEARAKASKSEQQGPQAADDSLELEDKRPYTPKLVRTVMQILPRSGHRVQPHSKTSARSSFLNMPMESSSEEIAEDVHKPPRSASAQIQSNRKKSKSVNRQMSAPPPTNAPSVKPRSYSDGTLPNQFQFAEHKFVKTSNKPTSASSSKDRELILKPTQSEPINYQDLNWTQNGASCKETKPRLLKLIKGRKENSKAVKSEIAINKQDTESSFELQSLSSKSRRSSESPITSVDKSSTDSEEFAPVFSSSSSTLCLDGLFENDSPVDDSPIAASTTTCQAQIEVVVPIEEEEHNNTSPRCSSVISLGDLFSADSVTSDIDLSEYPLQNSQNGDRSDSPASSTSSSAGFNLAFVPEGLFSRRSSMFSDSST